eukprot:TRINITY_DN8846_c0_g2_i1.p2 TRINITY_DN8846_c0_g2~~TRINITY_DN8846_c0_g2_i1.p2  ORF type:complete len:163 (+),score=23.34 TRINITY_DN8846_c0_g2_i1:619-1107(+)
MINATCKLVMNQTQEFGIGQIAKFSATSPRLCNTIKLRRFSTPLKEAINNQCKPVFTRTIERKQNFIRKIHRSDLESVVEEASAKRSLAGKKTSLAAKFKLKRQSKPTHSKERVVEVLGSGKEFGMKENVCRNKKVFIKKDIAKHIRKPNTMESSNPANVNS